MDKNFFQNLQDKYKINLMFHAFNGHTEKVLSAIKTFNFGGVVTNVPYEKGFITNKENLIEFDDIIKKCKADNLEYWIYDEKGYPSGQADGLILLSHKEFRAKGLYMRKFEAFCEDMDFVYNIDGVSDEIIYAVKYKQDLSDCCEAVVLPDTVENIDFEKRSVRVKIQKGEIAYIFIVKDAYEGSHSVHNISSRKKYINILSKEAVKAFIDKAYEPIAENVPNAFRGSRAVFTDEPSLMTAYARCHESFNYALVPYEKTIFSIFEKEYGYDLRGLLPCLFEDVFSVAPKIRIDFYNLIADIISQNYVGQINNFCKNHGTCLSGHYLAEERAVEHVMNYGNYVKVVSSTGYPGMDILQCTPLEFFHNAPKFLEMISKKINSNGFMVELCPFFNIQHFSKNPFDYIIGTVSLLYMNGARKINTYYLPNLSLINDSELSKFKGSMDEKQSVYLNNYVAAMGKYLDGFQSSYDTLVYYAIEDVQAKFIPIINGRYFRDKVLTSFDDSITELAEATLNYGLNYGFIDADGLKGAVNAVRIVVPAIEYISARTAKLLVSLEKNGVEILFLDKKPNNVVGGGEINFGKVVSVKQCAEIMEKNRDFKLKKGIFIKKFKNKDAKTAYMIYNNNENVAALNLSRCDIYDLDGQMVIENRESFMLKPFRAIFAELN